MCVNPLFLSNNYIERALREKEKLTPMKLQKILYFTYREYLKKTGKSLFADRFGTWQYGPVIENVYHKFKHYESTSIKDFYNVWDSQSSEPRIYKIQEKKDPELKAVINKVWESCKQKSGIELSHITHDPGGAWYSAYQSDEPFLLDKDIKIDDVEIK